VAGTRDLTPQRPTETLGAQAAPLLATVGGEAAERWRKFMEIARDYFTQSGVMFVEVEEATSSHRIPLLSK